MATNITFNGYSLQSSTIITSDIQHENLVQKKLNIQKFSDLEGGKFFRPAFDVKLITIKGTIVGTSASDLENTLDTFKKNLNYSEKNLDIEYAGGTRRYIATCSRMTFDRKYYTITNIDFELEFTVCNPPFGTNTDTTTLEQLAQTFSSASTSTGSIDGTPTWSGTFRPYPKIKITFNSCNGIRTVRFINNDEDGNWTGTYIDGYKFYDGDVLVIDTKEGSVEVNGVAIDFTMGFPRFSLANNRYSLKIIGNSYNVDLKIIYYPLWI